MIFHNSWPYIKNVKLRGQTFTNNYKILNKRWLKTEDSFSLVCWNYLKSSEIQEEANQTGSSVRTGDCSEMRSSTAPQTGWTVAVMKRKEKKSFPAHGSFISIKLYKYVFIYMSVSPHLALSMRNAQRTLIDSSEECSKGTAIPWHSLWGCLQFVHPLNTPVHQRGQLGG